MVSFNIAKLVFLNPNNYENKIDTSKVKVRMLQGTTYNYLMVILKHWKYLVDW